MSIFASGIDGAEGVAFDPLTNDLLVSTWQGTPRDSLIRITGFPPPVMPLMASRVTVPYTGGSVALTMHAGGHNTNRAYLLLGSVSGTSPGFVIDRVPIPLNLDNFSAAMVNLLNMPFFRKFAGFTDSAGRAAASLNVPPLPSAAIGLKVHLAGALVAPVTAASNAVTISVAR